MRASLFLSGLISGISLLACSGGKGMDSNDTACTGNGVVHACVVNGGAPVRSGGTITYESATESPVRLSTDANGCADLYLPPGTWTITATEESGCVAEEAIVDMDACLELILELDVGWACPG